MRSLLGVLCHQLPYRTLSLGGHPLPLCSRCTGLYLGIGLGVLYLLIRGRARGRGALPRLSRFLAAGLIAGMGVDGLGAFLSLWSSSLWFRFLTGLAAGSSLVFVIYPLLVPLLWKTAEDKLVLSGIKEYALLLLALVLGSLAVTAGPASLYWPVVLLSVWGVGITLVAVNLLLGRVLRMWAGEVGKARDLLAPVGAATVASWMELAVLGLVRAWWGTRM